MVRIELLLACYAASPITGAGLVGAPLGDALVIPTSTEVSLLPAEGGHVGRAARRPVPSTSAIGHKLTFHLFSAANRTVHMAVHFVRQRTDNVDPMP